MKFPAPAEVLEHLKCTECDMYLSRGPIYLQHDGTAVCGRCFSPNRPAIRNKEYEAVAKLLRFPCKNMDLGCGEIVDFVDENQEVAHEATCEYQQYVCPILGSSRCDWLGIRNQILQHCQSQHRDHVLDNPCSFAHDITTSNLHNFLIYAFQMLFLLHTKVCVTSGRIYHSMRLLNTTDMAKEFVYTVSIKRKNEVILKEDDVASQGCLVLQEPTALALSINSLLSVLGGWDGVKFTVAVEWRGRLNKNILKKQRNWGQVATVGRQRGQESMMTRQREQDRQRVQGHMCARCGANLKVMLYRDEGGWRCKRCSPAARACENYAQGCTYEDIDSKCYKHQMYFCQQSTRCYICGEHVSRGTLYLHYISAHRNVTHATGSAWRATRTDWRHCLVSCPEGTAVCEYSLNDLRFDLEVHIPVLSKRLYEYQCVMQVRQPSTGLTRSFTPDIEYKGWHDWYIKIDQQDFPSWSCDFVISVNINKM